MEDNRKRLRDASPYSGGLTREQFLFYEMRTTAGLLCLGMEDHEVIDKIEKENLFQYPTERMLRNLSGVCLKRLRGMESQELIEAVAKESPEIAKQICLYAMMKQYRLMWDFMITVIGDKYLHQDLDFSRAELNSFFLQLQEQDDYVASWSPSTIEKIKQVMVKVLVENEYLDSTRADHINPVMIDSLLERVIREKGEVIALPAFNCFW